jgi:hypothetical protein
MLAVPEPRGLRMLTETGLPAPPSRPAAGRAGPAEGPGADPGAQLRTSTPSLAPLQRRNSPWPPRCTLRAGTSADGHFIGTTYCRRAERSADLRMAIPRRDAQPVVVSCAGTCSATSHAGATARYDAIQKVGRRRCLGCWHRMGRQPRQRRVRGCGWRRSCASGSHRARTGRAARSETRAVDGHDSATSAACRTSGPPARPTLGVRHRGPRSEPSCDAAGRRPCLAPR